MSTGLGGMYANLVVLPEPSNRFRCPVEFVLSLRRTDVVFPTDGSILYSDGNPFHGFEELPSMSTKVIAMVQLLLYTKSFPFL